MTAAARIGKRGARVTPKLTPWTPVSRKPTIVGFYDYKYATGYTFNAEWTGSKFLIFDLKHPICNGDAVCEESGEQWRGLAADPAKAGK